jgi:hypothetical protein
MKRIDLTGRTFGRLTVLCCAGWNTTKLQLLWRCKCICGAEIRALGHNLRSGTTTSCGCRVNEINGARFKARHAAGWYLGEANPRAQAVRRRVGTDYIPASDPWFKICAGRWHDAKQKGILVGFASKQEFATYCKMIAPKVCPVFGKKFEGKGGFSPWARSIDRIDPKLGYVRGNVQIISNRANYMKRDATPEELILFAKWVLA